MTNSYFVMLQHAMWNNWIVLYFTAKGDDILYCAYLQMSIGVGLLKHPRHLQVMKSGLNYYCLFEFCLCSWRKSYKGRYSPWGEGQAVLSFKPHFKSYRLLIIQWNCKTTFCRHKSTKKQVNLYIFIETLNELT